MIFESVAVMTIIDLIVLAVIGRSLWVVLAPARSFADWRARTGRKAATLGLLFVGVFYAADLVAMHLLPLVIPRAEAMAFMAELHLNYSWVLAAGGIGLVIIGFTRIDLRLRKMVERLARSTEELKDSEAQYRHLVEVTGGDFAIYSLDANQIVRYINPGVERIFGVSPDEIVGKRWSEIVTLVEEDIPAAKKRTEAALAKGTVNSFEIRYRHRDGTVHTLEGQEVPKLDANGKVISLEGFAKDITERKQAEDALKESEARYRNLIEVTGKDYIIYSIDSNQVLQYVSPGVERILGKSADDGIGKHWHEVVPFLMDSAPTAIENVQAALKKGAVHNYEAQFHHADGTIHTLEGHNVPKLDAEGNVVGLEGFAKDITERKRAEFESERLRKGLKATGIGWYFWDVRNDSLEWDDCSLAIYGISRKEFSGTIDAWQDALHPDDREAVLKNLDELTKEDTTSDEDYRIVRPSGEVRYIHTEGFLERDDKGDLLYTFGINRDVTERRMKDEELRRSEEFLQTLLDTSPVPISISSKDDGRFLMVNRAIAETMQLSQDELLKHSTKEIYYNPDDRDDALKQLEKKGRLDNFDVRARRLGTGEESWFSLNVRPIDFEGEEALLMAAQDITERKRAEDKLRRREEFLQTLLDTSPIGIAITSKDDGRFLLVNKASCELHRLPAADLLQRSTWEIIPNPKDRAEILRRLEKTGRLENVDVRGQRLGTGEEIWLSVSSTPIEYEGQEAILGAARDVTESKKAEGELRESEALAQAILNTSFQLQGLLKPDGTLIEVNAAAMSMTDASKESLIGLPFWDGPWWAHNPNLQTRLREGVQQAARGDIVQFLATHITPDGSEQIMDFRMTPVRGANGDVEFIVPEGHDVTEIKQAGEEIRRSEEFLQTLLDTSPIGIAISSKDDGCFLMVNKAACEHHRLPAADLLQRSTAEIPINPERRAELMQQLAEKGRIDNVDIHARRLGTGEEWWLSISASLIDYEGQEAILTTTQDITERKKAEEEIRLASERLRLLMDNTPLGSIVVSLDRKIQYANPAALKMFGYTIDEVLGRRGRLFYANPNNAAEINKRVDSGELIQDHMVEMKRKDGTALWGLLSVFPMEMDGQPVLMASVYDVTERREMEEELRLARDAAEEATRAKDMFLAAMSHEIRTPMNGVIGMIELMQTTSLAKDQKQMLEAAKDSSFALLTIINDILDFSKIDAGKMKIEEVVFDLRKAADSVGEMLGLMAAEKGLPLVVHIRSEVPPLLLGDQVRIRQILLNLAGNAIKFTEDGEVHLGIKVAKTHKDGSVDILYEVKDSGIGMTEEQVSRLFKPFEQAETSTTRRYGGTGLGLSIVWRLTELMGGTIEVDSKSGKGSTFRVTLPHSVPKGEAGEAARVDLGRIKMLALSKVGSRLDLLSQLLKENDQSSLTRLSPTTKTDTLLKKLAAAEKGSDCYGLVYLSVDVSTREQDQLRKTIEADKNLKIMPRFLVERHNTPITQDIPGSVLIPPTPYTATNLVRALSIVLGKASPDITSPTEIEGRVAEVPTIEEAAAAGTLILVAEDNKTNQDVIGRQLAVFGYAHEIADDGRIALRMLSERSYGLLLCDVHMPNMDGYKLTQTIRKKKMKSGTRLPIVAVTANALQGEGDRCLEAGMDAYMTKPLSMKELRWCLQKWLPKGVEQRPSIGDVREAPLETEATDAAPVELDVLIEMFGDDEETLNSILSAFPSAAWEGIAEIESAHAAKDWAAVGDAGHKFKSSARTIGANHLADICEALEKAGKAGDDKTIIKLMPKLRPAMEAVEVYVRGRADASS